MDLRMDHRVMADNPITHNHRLTMELTMEECTLDYLMASRIIQAHNRAIQVLSQTIRLHRLTINQEFNLVSLVHSLAILNGAIQVSNNHRPTDIVERL